jgi:hypothetical protein
MRRCPHGDSGPRRHEVPVTGTPPDWFSVPPICSTERRAFITANPHHHALRIFRNLYIQQKLIIRGAIALKSYNTLKSLNPQSGMYRIHHMGQKAE